MSNLKRSIISMLLIIVLVLSSVVPAFAADTGTEPSKYSKEYNSGQRDVVCTTLDGTSALSYYTGQYTYDNLDDLSGSSLKSTLNTLMKSTHKYTSSYNDCHYKADRTDCENEDGSVLLIYTSYSATMSQWNGWNREHVWPQSLGGNNTKGGGADLHHIRPSDAGVNSSRGNKKYGEAGSNPSSKYGTNPAVGVLGGYYNSTYFEPLDNVKGDVARICLYVYVRWGSEWGASNITNVFQSIDILLEWCALDPVDTWEMGRNEVVQDIQGNRNVFIDYPELAWLLFDREIPSDMTTPSGNAKSGSSTTPSNPPVDNPPVDNPPVDNPPVDNPPVDNPTEKCEHTQTVLKNAVSADCGKAGYTGDTYCADCDALISQGNATQKTDTHAWSDLTVRTEPTENSVGEGVYVCGICKAERVEVLYYVAWGESYATEAEKIIAIISKNAFDTLLYDYLVKTEE